MKGRDVVLGLLMKKPRTGYQIKLMFQDVFSHFYDGSYGMIYPTLRQLEKEGKITKETILQDGKPSKNLFSITDSGVDEFENYLHDEMGEDVMQSDFLMRMHFGEYVEEEQIVFWIKETIERKEKGIEHLEKIPLEGGLSLTVSQEIGRQIGIATYTAEVNVLKEKLKELEDGKK